MTANDRFEGRHLTPSHEFTDRGGGELVGEVADDALQFDRKRRDANCLAEDAADETAPNGRGRRDVPVFGGVLPESTKHGGALEVPAKPYLGFVDERGS